MGIAQAAQAVATMLALGLLLTNIGPKLTITVGAASWMVLYIIYCLNTPKWTIVVAQVFLIPLGCTALGVLALVF